jgi:hypothetical protein
MPEVTLDLLMIAVQRALDDLRLLKDAVSRVERHAARWERRDAELLAMIAEDRAVHADELDRINQLAERVDRIERRLELQP